MDGILMPGHRRHEVDLVNCCPDDSECRGRWEEKEGKRGEEEGAHSVPGDVI